MRRGIDLAVDMGSNATRVALEMLGNRGNCPFPGQWPQLNIVTGRDGCETPIKQRDARHANPVGQYDLGPQILACGLHSRCTTLHGAALFVKYGCSCLRRAPWYSAQTWPPSQDSSYTYGHMQLLCQSHWAPPLTFKRIGMITLMLLCAIMKQGSLELWDRARNSPPEECPTL